MANPTPPSPGATATPSPAGPCVKCASQEDFDAAQKKGQSCCPGHACTGDGDCHGGRVCCRIPNGQLCSDAARCAKADRVGVEGQKCTRSKDCTGLEICCSDSKTCTAQSHCTTGLACKTDIDCHVTASTASSKCVADHCQ